jgi:hypothetical protein
MSLQSRSIGDLLSEVSMVMCVDVAGDQPTDRTSSTQSWCDCQSHVARSQETWVRNGRWILPTGTTSSIHARRVGIEPANLGPSGEHANHYSTEGGTYNVNSGI